MRATCAAHLTILEQRNVNTKQALWQLGGGSLFQLVYSVVYLSASKQRYFRLQPALTVAVLPHPTQRIWRHEM
jgi:hypothetical protein